MTCKLMFGDRGSGKSTTLLALLYRFILAGVGSSLVIDPPGTLVRDLVGHVNGSPLERHLLLDYADPRKARGRYLRWPFLRASDDPDELIRQNDDDLAIAEFLQAFFALRDVKDGTQAPYTYKAARAAVRVYLGLPVPPPIKEVLCLFRLGEPVREWMLAATRDQRAATVFRDAEARSRRDPRQYEVEIGAGGRLIEGLDSVLWVHHGGDPAFWERVIETKRHVLLDLSGVDPRVARAMGIIAYTGFFNANVRLFQRTGVPHPAVCVIDEMGEYDFASPVLISHARLWRKAGTAFWGASQTVHDFRSQETLEALLGLSEHYWHAMSSGLDRAAADICDASFRSDEVHFERERQQHDGFDTVETISRGEADTRVHETFRARFRTVVEHTYKTPHLKHAEIKVELAQHATGQYHFRGVGGVVRRERTIMLGEPWPLGLTPIRTDKAIDRIRSTSLYQPAPPPWTPPTAEPVPPLLNPRHRPDASTPPRGTDSPPTRRRGAASRLRADEIGGSS